jgi:hypothetical protein
VKPLNVDPGKLLLFRVTEKRNDREPDFRGVANVGGITYEIGIWENESKRGVPYWAGTIRPPRDQAAIAERPADDVDIPFGDAPASRVDDDALRRQANQSFNDATKSRRW